MKKFIIETKANTYVERFFGAAVLVTNDKARARRYTKVVAQKRLSKHNLTFRIVEINN